jgi:hypothetical protein
LSDAQLLARQKGFCRHQLAARVAGDIGEQAFDLLHAGTADQIGGRLG